jgi:hypothetical protein
MNRGTRSRAPEIVMGAEFARIQTIRDYLNKNKINRVAPPSR